MLDVMRAGTFQSTDEPARLDDALFEGRRPGELEEKPQIIVADKIEGNVHTLDERWLRSRVRGWMTAVESPDLDFWIGCYTAEGKWIYCSSREDRYAPSDLRFHYALRVCRHLNKNLHGGGAWLVGWIRGGRTFYLLWKDKDGDIQIPIEAEKTFHELSKYGLDDWLQHASQAVMVWSEWKKQLELAGGQQKKLAQGERVSSNHLEEAPAPGI